MIGAILVLCVLVVQRISNKQLQQLSHRRSVWWWTTMFACPCVHMFIMALRSSFLHQLKRGLSLERKHDNGSDDQNNDRDDADSEKTNKACAKMIQTSLEQSKQPQANYIDVDTFALCVFLYVCVCVRVSLSFFVALWKAPYLCGSFSGFAFVPISMLWQAPLYVLFILIIIPRWFHVRAVGGRERRRKGERR